MPDPIERRRDKFGDLRALLNHLRTSVHVGRAGEPSGAKRRDVPEAALGDHVVDARSIANER